jgi:hypothetical protein
MSMRGFWSKVRGKHAEPQDDAASLHRLFADYPANPPRHAGPPEALTLAQQDDNLAAFLADRDTRLTVIQTFFAARGIGAAPLLDASMDGGAAAAAIDAWLNEMLPRRPFSPVSGDPQPNPDERAFRLRGRTGADRYYSFVDDLASLEGEAIRRRDPRFSWAVNRLPELDGDGRICLIKAGQAGWAPLALDIAAHLLAICHAKMAPGGDATGHHFGELLAAARAGSFDPGGVTR